MPNGAELLSFLKGHYRHDRLLGRGADYTAAVVAGRIADLERLGVGCISRHESVTGAVVLYDSSLNILPCGTAEPNKTPWDR